MPVQPVPAASPSTVLPAHIASEFVRTQEWANDINEYANGERQSRARVATPIVKWKLKAHVSEAVIMDLFAFLRDRKFIEAFWVYDGTETSPPWTVDLTGASSIGRYVVIAKLPLSFSIGMARSEMPIVLEQRA